MNQAKKFKYAVVKTLEHAAFGNTRQLPVVNVTLFESHKWSGLKPGVDDLIQYPEIILEDNKISIKGEKIKFSNEYKRYFDKKIYFLDEKNDKQELKTLEDALLTFRAWTKNKTEIDISQIKLGYDSFKSFLLRKKTFYISYSPSIISAISNVKEHEIKENKKGFYVEGWCETTLTEPYHIEATGYKLYYK